MLWGGLIPIPEQLALDVVVLLGLCYAVYKSNVAVLLASCALTLATAGPTNRWTLTLPMVPLLFFQGLRRIPRLSRWSGVFTVLSLICILSGAILSVLFPAVELPAINGPYEVGMIDFHLPLGASGNATTCDASGASHLPVRILYPTLEQPKRGVPYLKPETAKEFCRQSMKFGAPGPLKELGWILHTWRLTGLRVHPEAPLAPDPKAFPVVVYSHGLGGSAEIYTYQTMSLAAHGAIVLAVNHLDGTAPVVQRSDGELVLFDNEIVRLWRDGKREEYVRRRRSMTDARADAVIAATETFLQLNEHDAELPELAGLSLRGRLQTDHTFFMGHSFGASTALAAAEKRPDLVRSAIAHEPAVDWMPEYALRALFDEDRLKRTNHTFEGGTGGYQEEAPTTTGSLHDLDLLIMFSEEWRVQKWGWSHILEAWNNTGDLGGRNSEFHVVKQAHHTEFSDTSMMTPLWLARPVGVTGDRNPTETAQEIAERTRAFVDTVRAS